MRERKDSAFDRRKRQVPVVRGPSGITTAELPNQFDLGRLGQIEVTVARRGAASKHLIDDRIKILDAAHGRSLPEKMETVDRIDAVGDVAIAARIEFAAVEMPPRYLKGDFWPVARRAYVVLENAQVVRKAGRFRGPNYTTKGMEHMAKVVAAFHVYRHTPRAERGEGWPPNAEEFAKELAIQGADVREAIYQSQYHKWEERYLPKVSSAARVSRIKDSLEHNVLRQDDLDDPSKVNANLYRTALQSEGAIQSTQKGNVQVNVNSNVMNLPEGLTEESLRARLDRVNRLAQKLEPKETPHVELGTHRPETDS